MKPRQIPPDVEQMIQDGAERRGLSRDEYIEKMANDIHGVLAKRRKEWLVRTDKQLRKFWVTYQKLEEEAARTGVQVAQLLEAYFRIIDDNEAPKTPKHH